MQEKICRRGSVKSLITLYNYGSIISLLRTKLTLIHQHPQAAALLLMLYLPEESHCGGSSEPAWVASSWVWTPPTQSFPPPLLALASPPRGRGDGIPGWILPLSKLRGCSPTVGVSRFPGCHSGVPGQPRTL